MIVYQRTCDLMEAELGDELVALDAERGTCFGFNEVATCVWKHLAEPATLEQIREGLLEEYEVAEPQCTSELSNLLEDLEKKGLIAKRGTCSAH